MKAENLTGGKASAVIVHRRHARKVVSWRQTSCPSVTLSGRRRGDSCHKSYISFGSVHLPHSGHESNIWEASITEVEETVKHILQTGQLFLAGDFNTAEFAQRWGGMEDTIRPLSERAGPEAFLRAQHINHFMQDNSLVSLTPHGGHQATHFPYNAKSQPRTLDYQLRPKAVMLGCTCSTDVVDLALATDHRALIRLLHGRREGLVEGRRQGKRPPKRRYVRRKWDGWKEATLGQFEALPQPESWKTMHDAEKILCLAGVAAAATKTRARGHGPTPFDDCIFTLQQERHKARDPEERKLLTRCVFAARRFRRNWKYDQTIKRCTKLGKTMQNTSANALA